jgi:4-amino-4-deoxy-L-arabinose transferase-like glycosyltransferase
MALVAAVFAAGAAVRIWFVADYRPAFLGNADSATYAWAAAHDLFHSPVRPAGYPVFLRLVHAVTPHLTYTIVLQHILGLATAGLLYGLLRRVGVSTVLALLAAAVVLFDGMQIFLEHSLMSDTIFAFLVVAGLYAAVRADGAEAGAWPWLAASGVLIGLTATIRTLGAFLVPMLALWVLLERGALRERIKNAALSGGVAAAVVVLYLVVQWSTTGVLGLTQADGYNLYSRAATFADCSKFHPPPGTRPLCETTPPSRRQGGIFYEWEPASPAGRAFGGMPRGTRRLESFSRAAILHQPLDYLEAVGRDLYRYVNPAAFYRTGAGGGPREVIEYSRSQQRETQVLPLIAANWSTNGFIRRDANGLIDYAKTANIPGGALVALLLLAACAPFVARSGARRAAALLLATGVILLVVPVASLLYDGRYTLPAYAPIAGAAAIALQVLLNRLRRRAGAGADRQAPVAGAAA